LLASKKHLADPVEQALPANRRPPYKPPAKAMAPHTVMIFDRSSMVPCLGSRDVISAAMKARIMLPSMPVANATTTINRGANPTQTKASVNPATAYVAPARRESAPPMP